MKGALVSSGAGIGLSLAADFIGGTVGSALEQKIGSGSVSLKESLVGGVTNAVSGAIYGKGPLKGFGDALMKGAASGAATAESVIWQGTGMREETTWQEASLAWFRE